MDERRDLLGVRWWPDVAVAATVVCLAVVGTLHIDQGDAARATDALAVACGVVGGTALAFWRRWTIPMLVVVAVALSIYLVRGYPGGPAMLPGPVAMAYVGARARRPLVWWIGVGFATMIIVGRWIGDRDFGVEAIVGIGWVVAALFGGQALAARSDRMAAERERREHAQQQAVAQERLRIARDLHDSVAHAMATINVQSGVAAHLIDRRPEQAKVALEAIRRASSDVLDELGAILGALRRDDGAAPRAPAAGLDRLDDLVERSAADGVAVTCTVAGDPAVVPPSVSAAAYRVIQEALSNTRRHAGTAPTATVAVTIDGPGAVAVDVCDDGGHRATAVPQPSAPGLGFGLVGMRERVEATGGVLTAGPRPIPARGFSVRAVWGTR